MDYRERLLVEVAFDRARPALERAREPANTGVIVVGRGASDPDANGDFCKVVRLFAEGRGLGWVVPSFIGITQPIYDVAPDFGARLAAIVASGIAILHIIGPITTRYALVASGEGEQDARD